MGTCPHTLNRDSLTQTTPSGLISNQYGTVTGYKMGHVACISFRWKSSSTESCGTGQMGTLPVGFRPPVNLGFSYGGRDNTSQKMINISKDGVMSYANQGGVQGNNAFADTLTYLTI